MEFELLPKQLRNFTIAYIIMFVVAALLGWWSITDMSTFIIEEFLPPIILFVLLIFGVVYIYVIMRKDILSKIFVSGSGIEVYCYGKVWFEASWSELYICQYSHTPYYGSKKFMVFSKKPLKYDDLRDRAHRMGGKNRQSDGGLVFATVTPTFQAEVLKYVRHDDIKRYGVIRPISYGTMPSLRNKF